MGHPLDLDKWDDQIEEEVAAVRKEFAALPVRSIEDSRKHLPGLVRLFLKVLRVLNIDKPERVSDLRETRHRLPFGYSIWPPRHIGEPILRNDRYKQLAIEITERMHEALDWLIESSFLSLAGSDAAQFPRQSLADLERVGRELSRLFDGMYEPDEQGVFLDKYVYAERIEVMVAPLEEKGGGASAISYHTDFYRSRGVRGPRLRVTEVLGFPPKPKYLPLLATFEARRRQVDFAEHVVREYQALASRAPLATPVLVWPGFPHRDDHLRTFLDLVYSAHGGGYTVAIERVLPILQAYYDGFTLSSTNNVPDQGLGPKSSSYLNGQFPRAMTGQRIHDCAVFAVRTAFLFGGILKDLGLTPYFGSMPLHMGVVAVAADSLSADADPPPPTESISSGGLLIAHNHGLHLVDAEDFAKATENWRTYDAPCGPEDDAFQLAGEAFTAGFWGRSVLDTPFRLAPIPDTSASGVWSAYLAILNDDLFSGVGTEPPMPQVYFRFMDESKAFYNSEARQFWNVDAAEIYKSIVDMAGPHGLPASFMVPLKRAPLAAALDAAFAEVESGFLSMASGHWPDADLALCASPTPLAPGVRVTCAVRAGGIRGLGVSRDKGSGCVSRRLLPSPWRHERDGPLMFGWQRRIARYINQVGNPKVELPDPPPAGHRLPLQT